VTVSSSLMERAMQLSLLKPPNPPRFFILSILGASTAYIRDAPHSVTLSRPFVAPAAPKLSCCRRRKSLLQQPPVDRRPKHFAEFCSKVTKLVCLFFLFLISVGSQLVAGRLQELSVHLVEQPVTSVRSPLSRYPLVSSR
jgi:hypothetical protein